MFQWGKREFKFRQTTDKVSVVCLRIRESRRHQYRRAAGQTANPLWWSICLTPAGFPARESTPNYRNSFLGSCLLTKWRGRNFGRRTASMGSILVDNHGSRVWQALTDWKLRWCGKDRKQRRQVTNSRLLEANRFQLVEALTGRKSDGWAIGD